MTSLEIWIYEERPALGRHSTLSLREAAAGLAAGRDVLDQTMDCAVRDVEAGRFSLKPSACPVGGRVR